MLLRNFLLAAAASTLGAVGAAGQGLGAKVSVVTSLKPQPHVTVTNNWSSPLTSLVIVMSTASAPRKPVAVAWYDSGLYFTHNPPLATGQSYSFPFGPANLAPNLQPHLLAIGFQDGEAFGEQRWLSEIRARREAAYRELATVTALVNRALAEHEPEAGIISSLETARGSLTCRVSDVWPRMAAEFVIFWATGNLKRAGVPGHIGDPQMTIPLVILPWFSRWRAALKRYDPSLK